MKLKLNSRTPLLLAFTYMLIPVFFLVTNPEKLPLPVLMVPFILIFMAIFLTVQVLLGKYLPNLGIRPRKVLSLSLATLPVLLLILQSIGQLSLRDLLITSGLLLGLVIYFRKTDFLK